MTSTSFRTATRYAAIAAIAATLAQFGIRPAGAFAFSVAYDSPYPPFAPVPDLELAPWAAEAGAADRTVFGVPMVTFTIPLAALDEVRRLDQRPEIAEILETARRHSDSRIYLAAYDAPDDVPAPHVEASGVADELVIEVGTYLARRGVEADRISGKGMGIDSTIGRAVVVSFDVTPLRIDPPSPAQGPWWPAPTNAAAPVLHHRTGQFLWRFRAVPRVTETSTNALASEESAGANWAPTRR